MPTAKQEPVLEITRFFTGMVTQRSALNTPFAYAGLNVITRHDALINGLNCELSNNYTLQRRPGLPRYCTQLFAANEFPLSYFSARINGQVVDFVDTNLAVYTFSPTTLNILFTKSAGAGQTFFQNVGNVVYFSNGVDNKKWAPPALQWAANKAFNFGQLIADPNGNIQQVTTVAIPGKSGLSQPTWSTTPITGTTGDGTLVWTCRGSQVSNWGIASPVAAPSALPTLAAGSAVRFWAPSVIITGTNYTIVDTNGNVQLTSAGGATGTQPPVWNTTMAATTVDSGVTWICLGPIESWQPSHQYLQSGPDACVLDSNNNLQHPGGGSVPFTTGTTAPTWNASLNGATTDGSLVWGNDGPGKFLATSGYQWVFAYHTCYGHVSTASSITINTGPIIGSSLSVPISGTGSADPQCDFIWIFRIRDGGSVFEFAGQVANPGAVTWNFTDTVVDQDLDDQLIAAQDHLNDPPPAGMTVLALHMKRMWAGVGNVMQYGIGVDRGIGVAEESWPPANFETYASPIQKLAPTTQGLCVVTNDEWWVELGGPETLGFYPKRVLGNFGISSPNCLVQDGDQIFLYTTQKQLFSLSLADGKSEDGFAVGDVLTADFDPAKTYLTIHRNGIDQGLFVSDGSTNIFRYSLNLNCWGTLYGIVGGVGAIGSIESSFGTYSLMAGRATGAGSIMARSLTSFFDDIASATYPWNADIGSIHFSSAGQATEALESIVLQTTGAGTQPTIGVRINEIGGDFINVPVGANDPHDAPSTTAPAKRYDLTDMQQQTPIEIRHMQVRIAGVAENAKSEIIGLSFCPQIAA